VGGPFNVCVFVPEQAASIVNFDRFPVACVVAQQESSKQPTALVVVRNSAGRLMRRYRSGQRVSE